VEGVKTTVPLHKKIIDTKAFVSGDFTTKFMEEVKL
jgi:acetyl-CoA carboxylase biotin carboxylase subunit